MNKALFLDRDGTINKDYEYVYEIKKLEILDGVIDGLKYAMSKGYMLIIITNQSGIGMDYYSVEDMEKFNNELYLILEEKQIHIDKIFYCPHNISDNCECRKPSPKMIIDASIEFNVDLEKSYMIGDKDSDILCGKNAGCKTILLKGNYQITQQADYVINNFREIIHII